MEWIRISSVNDIPQGVQLLFIDSRLKTWFPGKLIQDEEYDLTISREETYHIPDFITHYLQVNMP